MIKNLLFDLGGVIMDIEKDRCVEAFTRLGLPDAPSYFGVYSQQGPFMQLEEGEITAADFHRAMREAIGRPDVTDDDIDAAFCRFLIGIPVRRLADLRALRKRYRIYMLSNTNPIMWNSRIRTEFEQEGLTREDYFDGIVTSYEAGAMKPDARIFRHVVGQLGIEPSETVFLDDSERNLTAAAALGFGTQLVRPGEEFMTLLNQRGL